VSDFASDLTPRVATAYEVRTPPLRADSPHLTIGHVSLRGAVWNAFPIAGVGDIVTVRGGVGFSHRLDGYTTPLDAVNALIRHAVERGWCHPATPPLTTLPA